MASSADFWQGPSGTLPVVNANGNIFEEVQVATGGQTIFNLASFTYTVGQKSIWVFRKTAADAGIGGEMLRRAVDYTETSSSRITLAAGAVVGDTFYFIAFGVNQLIAPVVNNGVPQGGTTGQILTKQSASDYDTIWQSLASITTLLDAPRQNIASASTVNLVPLAATTRNIAITGSIQIDGFAVSAGQVWAVKFAASLLLKNNGNISTQSGGDIKVTPGASCFLRATADNIVEVLSFVQGAGSIVRAVNDFRLTSVSGSPVTATENAAVLTLFASPYVGNAIALYDGISWNVRQSAEFSIALAGLTFPLPYDVFCWDNAGVPTLEIAAWSTSTVRATTLVRQDGVLVKNGAPTRRYLGTFTARGANNTSWTSASRDIWNYYHRQITRLYVVGDAANWTYVTNTIRQARASALNQLNFVVGVVENPIDAHLAVRCTNSAATANIATGIGFDTTTAFTEAECVLTSSNTRIDKMTTHLTAYPVLNGSHFLSWNEQGDGVGTATFFGSIDGTMHATLMM